MADPKTTILNRFLSSGSCGMHRFTKPEFPSAYFCAECKVGSKDGACERDKLKDQSP
jgi:hypothetical protein